MFAGRVVVECPVRTIEQFDQHLFRSVAVLLRSGREHRDVPRHLGMLLLMVATTAALLVGTDGNYPVFEAAYNMRNLLLPADTRIGSIVYRLRATDADRDYPLTFAATDYGSYVIKIEPLPCYVNASTCLANVYLERSVAPGQVYKFRLTVRDTTGDTTTLAVTIEVSNGRSDVNSVFPHIPGVIMVPEDTKVGTELEYVIARRNSRISKQTSFELWKEINGSYLHKAPEFQLVQSSKKDTATGLIKLAQELDYEQQTMYRLSVYALDMYVVPGEDSRNIAGFQLVVVVADVQDTSPIFDHIDPITILPINLTEGDLVMKVTARDGDTGSPRQIKYGLVSEGNPFTVFFSIGRDTGEIRLARPLRELSAISYSHQPILLTVLAEEVVNNVKDPPALSTEAKVALLLGELGNKAPYFQSQQYIVMLEENSVQGTQLVFGSAYNTEVRDDDMGKQGVFSLSLENNNGTFEVSPSLAEGRTNFVIKVRDNTLLDYESQKVLMFKVVAQEVAPGKKPLFSSVNVTVFLIDMNDNPPNFKEPHYAVSMPENVTIGYQVVVVTATDPDTGLGGLIKYTRILGHLNTSLSLHPVTGTIFINKDNHGFDREQAAEYRFLVEARDNDGQGNQATVPLTIQVIDINDNPPKFLRDPMDFILAEDGLGFTERVFIKAIDADAEPPNNIVRYEIVSGNYGDRFSVHGETGELRVVRAVNRPVRQTTLSLSILTVRAYDMGVPTMWSVAQVRIYPWASGARVLTFIVPGAPDKASVRRMLESVTGGQVTVQEVSELPQNYQGPAQDLTRGSENSEKSVVVATVLYTGQPVLNIDKLQHQLNNRTEIASVGHYQTENRALFWILLIILLLIAITLITLLCCCLCPCCPLFALTKKRSRVHSTENVHFVVKEEEPGHESKAVQAERSATDRKEAWSGDTYTRRSWQFNRRNTQPQRVVLVARAGPEVAGSPRQAAPVANHTQAPLSVIYTRDLQQRQDHIILEDIDGTEYRVLDPSRLSLPVRLEDDPDAESIRRHEFDRGSETGRLRRGENQATIRPRDQMFIRDGNAEILRLVTRGRIEEEEPRLNQPDTRPYTVVEGVENVTKQDEEGKDIIMKRFIEDQKKSTENSKGSKKETLEENEAEEKKNDSESDHLLQRLMDVPQRNLSTGDVNRLTTLQRDLLLTRFLVEEQRRHFSNVQTHDDTQSLPGMVTVTTTMATQTDVNRGTQTEMLCTMRPPRRKAKSDLDDSGESDTETSYDVHGKLIRKYKKNRRKTNRTYAVPERGRSLSRCEIKTPILEENESPLENVMDYSQPHYSKGIAHQSGFAATKSSMLRLQITRKKLHAESNLDQNISPPRNKTDNSRSSLVGTKKISVSEQNLPSTSASYVVGALRDIERSARAKSLQATPISQRKDFNMTQQKTGHAKHGVGFEEEYNSDDDYDRDIFDRSKSSLSTRNASTSPIQTFSRKRSFSAEKVSSDSKNSPTQKTTKSTSTSTGTNSDGRKTPKQSRYMEWYKKKKEERERKKIEEAEMEKNEAMKPIKPLTRRISRKDTPTPNRLVIETKKSTKASDMKSTQSETKKKQNTVKHSTVKVLEEDIKSNANDEKTFSERKERINELKDENKPRLFDDDRDSGIAMLAPGSQKMKRKNQNLMEKKSVFTIVYDDMQTKQLRLNSATPP